MPHPCPSHALPAASHSAMSSCLPAPWRATFPCCSPAGSAEFLLFAGPQAHLRSRASASLCAQQAPARWQCATPLASPPSPDYMWHFGALTICFQMFSIFVQPLGFKYQQQLGRHKAKLFWGAENSHPHRRARTHTRVKAKNPPAWERRRRKPSTARPRIARARQGRHPEGRKAPTRRRSPP